MSIGIENRPAELKVHGGGMSGADAPQISIFCAAVTIYFYFFLKIFLLPFPPSSYLSLIALSATHASPKRSYEKENPPRALIRCNSGACEMPFSCCFFPQAKAIIGRVNEDVTINKQLMLLRGGKRCARPKVCFKFNFHFFSFLVFSTANNLDASTVESNTRN